MHRTSRTAMVALLCASLLFVAACGSGDDGASSPDTTVASLELSRTPDTGAPVGSADSPTDDGTAPPTSTTGGDGVPIELTGSYCEMAAQAEDQTYSFDFDADDPAKALLEAKEGFATSVATGRILRDAAPAAIAADVDAILEALEQANPRVQAATSMDEVAQAFSNAIDDDFMTHANNVSDYDRDECGIEPDSEPSPSDD